MKPYNQYCPVAHALDLVGERWSLLLVRELQHGPLRYSDLHERLPRLQHERARRRGCRGLEAGGVVQQAATAAARRLDRLRADRDGRGARARARRARPLGRADARPPPDATRRPHAGLAREGAPDRGRAFGARTRGSAFRLGDEAASLWTRARCVPGLSHRTPTATVTATPRRLLRSCSSTATSAARRRSPGRRPAPCERLARPRTSRYQP